MRKRTGNVGFEHKIEKDNVHGVAIKESVSWIENVTNQKAESIIKKYNVKIDKHVYDDVDTEVAIIYDKKDGIPGYVLLLPPSGGKSYPINKGNGIDNLHSIRLLASLYL